MPSTTRGSILISTANDIGSTLVDKLGGDGYTPEEWDSAANLCGIASADIATALSNIQESTPGGADRGSISIAKANSIGRILNKKFDTSRGFKPSEWASAIDKLTPLEIKSASGAIASFVDGADGVPVKSCSVSFVASGGGGTPSAPVAISGVSGLSVYRYGKNFFDGFTKGYRVNASTGAIEENANGAISGYIPVKESTAYYISGLTNTIHSFIAYYKADKTYISRTSGNNKVSASLTTPSECAYAVVCQYISNDSGTLDDLDNLQTQLELGSSATTYSAYVTPSVVTDTFGQTIYGGTRDLTTDKASVTYGYHKVNASETGSDYLAGTNNNGNRIGFTLSDAESPKYSGCLSNCFENRACLNSATWTVGSFCIYGTKIYIVCPNEYNTYQKCLDYLLSINAEFAYPLATPTEITGLTPHEIDTLYGDNNIYADTGTMEVEYRADIDLALNA